VSGGGGAPEPAPGGGGTVRVGLVVPQSGVYAGLGADMRQGWELWLDQNGGRFGDYTVETIIADEGETPQTGGAAVQQVLQADRVDMVVGIVNSAVAINAAPLFAEAKKILMVANAGAAAVTGASGNPYVWRSSFQNAQIAAPMGTHLGGQAVQGGVFVLAPDYAAGEEVISGFSTAYEAAGGTIAGTVKPPFGSTTDYQPFLTQIQQSGAGAVFCFFSGAEALSFVTQYEAFGLKGTTPLYGSGFLTEGDVLQSQGAAALGVQTTLHYSSVLDNPANQAFAQAYREAHGEQPTCFAMQTWDAANVLNRALAGATALDGDTLSAALGGIGTVEDSPRGPWTFEGQSPLQNIYLRTVEQGDGLLVNAITEDLGQQGQVT
ncbi:MAG: ABC transporter substrate-binding protein, partial [Pseudonocardia sp.]|nr:ABC transporter substrate-binding protein [Pseudonocardia sp.]